MTRPLALIVEDDSDLRGALTRSLRLKGFEVRSAEHGQEAWDILFLEAGSYQPVVVLSDHDMPFMTGSSLYEKIKIHLPQLEPRFILMSGGSKGPAFAKDNGIPFLDKPFTDEALQAAIDSVLP